MKACLKIVSCLLLVVSFAVFTPLQAVWADETITMAFTRDPAEDASIKFLELVYIEAFRRLGLEFTFRVYPMTRGVYNANVGEMVDGVPARISESNEEFQNLIQVEEPIITFKLSAFATNPEISLSGWDSLQGTSYNVECILGSQRSEEQLSKFVSKDRLSFIATIPQALKKLKANRTDVFVYVEPIVQSVLKSEEFKDNEIHMVGMMEEILLYPYLHKKHADFVPKLADALKQMKEEGLFGKYRAQAAEAVAKQ